MPVGPCPALNLDDECCLFVNFDELESVLDAFGHQASRLTLAGVAETTLLFLTACLDVRELEIYLWAFPARIIPRLWERRIEFARVRSLRLYESVRPAPEHASQLIALMPQLRDLYLQLPTKTSYSSRSWHTDRYGPTLTTIALQRFSAFGLTRDCIEPLLASHNTLRGLTLTLTRRDDAEARTALAGMLDDPGFPQLVHLKFIQLDGDTSSELILRLIASCRVLRSLSVPVYDRNRYDYMGAVFDACPAGLQSLEVATVGNEGGPERAATFSQHVRVLERLVGARRLRALRHLRLCNIGEPSAVALLAATCRAQRIWFECVAVPVTEEGVHRGFYY